MTITIFEVVEKATGKRITTYPTLDGKPVELLYMGFDTHDHLVLSVQEDSPTGPVFPQFPVYGGRRQLTHGEYRLLFTPEEKEDIDEFIVLFETLPLPPDTKRRMRSGLKDYEAAEFIDLDDPRVAMLLGVFAAMDKISPNRIEVILHG